MTSLARTATAITVGVALSLTAACGSSASTGTTEDAIGEQLSATVPSSPRSTTTTTTTGIDSTATTTTGALPAACTLLTEADATAAFGEPALAVDDRTDECWWSSANDLKTINLIRRTDDVATWRSGYQNSSWTPNDLGDEGYTGSVFDSVVWRVGDVQYEVNVVYSTSGDARQIATDLAEKIDARL